MRIEVVFRVVITPLSFLMVYLLEATMLSDKIKLNKRSLLILKSKIILQHSVLSPRLAKSAALPTKIIHK